MATEHKHSTNTFFAVNLTLMYSNKYARSGTLVMRTDPSGMDWYEDEGGKYQYNPNLNAKNYSSILTEGQQYLGATVKRSGANYRSDGSIMFTKESTAYSRMVDRSNQTGNESMGVLTNNGVLVVPDYKNTSSTVHASVDLRDYGYSTKDGNVVDAAGNVFNTLATVHTHPGGGSASTYLVDSYGDLGFASSHTPYKPVYIFEMGTKQSVSFIVAKPNNLQYVEHNITTYTPSFTITSLVQGKYSLIDYTKSQNFREVLNSAHR